MRADLLACVLRPESVESGGPGTPTTTVVLPPPRTPPAPSPTPAGRKAPFIAAGAAVGALAILAIGYASLRGAWTKKPEPVLSPDPAQNAAVGFAGAPASGLVGRPVPEPVVKPVPEPVVKPMPEPVVKPVLKPVAKPRSNHCARPLHSEHGVEKISTPVAGTGDGVLVVLALPWGEVSVCGAPYGEAPVELRVRAGTYTVLVEHASRSEPQTVTVNAGSRSFVRVNFAKNK
jgi:hypothetical protein